MRIRFWGTRGSIARPGPATLRYGGNTSCAEVVTDDGTLAVLDCGTGAYELARDLRRRGALPAIGHLLIGHAHWDHIQGFPFFEPLYDAPSEWRIHAPGDQIDHLQQTFARQMSPEHHPIALGDLKAQVSFRVLTEGTFPVGGIRVTAQYLHHPALTLGYRLEADGASLVYATDHEPHAVPLHGRHGPTNSDAGVAPVHPEDRRHVSFLAGADLVVHDAQYTLAEYPQRRGWGHTPVECAVDYAIAAAAKRLALFHHDPDRDDVAVDALVMSARERVAKSGAALEVFAAAEGQEIELRGAWLDARPTHSSAGSALLAPAPLPPRTVLVAEDDLEVARGLEAVLHGDGLRLVHVTELGAAIDAARRAPPSLVLLDLAVPRGELLAACRKLRGDADPRLREIPVLVVADTAPNESEVREVFEAGATDYLSRPIKPTLLRSRIRGWLMRAQS
jgi:phosphoribosyl 1,2-cyclic phosphodiesterase/CheY-like chemotaxis protein